MATWIAHLRIADNLLNQVNIANENEFIVGNIGPDCGVPNEDWSRFDPPGEVSHWCFNEDGEIDYESFYAEYCRNRTSDFYLGYYVHLVTDTLWREIIFLPKKHKYKDEFDRNKNFIWTMKQNWYDLDKKFLNDNDLYAYSEFIKIQKFRNTYLDFYSKDAITSKIKYITDFYESRDKNINRDFIYLTEREMDEFVRIGTERIFMQLIRVGETGV